jgi:hypothetical protein
MKRIRFEFGNCFLKYKQKFKKHLQKLIQVREFVTEWEPGLYINLRKKKFMFIITIEK